MTPERTSSFRFSHPLADCLLSFLVRMDAATSTHMTSFPDLLDQSDFVYGVIRGSDTQHVLSVAQPDVLRRTWNVVRQNADEWNSDNMFEALERIRRQNYALIVDSELARYYISQRPCDLAMLDIVETGFSRGWVLGNVSASVAAHVDEVADEVRANAVEWRATRARWWRQECNGGQSEKDTAAAEDGRTGKFNIRHDSMSISESKHSVQLEPV